MIREQKVTLSMEQVDIPYESVKGEAAFYGPKIDLQIRNVVGREESASTNQLDLIMAERFDLFYIGSDNQRHRPHIVTGSVQDGRLTGTSIHELALIAEGLTRILGQPLRHGR